MFSVEGTVAGVEKDLLEIDYARCDGHTHYGLTKGIWDANCSSTM